jgi:hypothetical protein
MILVTFVVNQNRPSVVRYQFSRVLLLEQGP